ncbi:DUF6232 family protein [Spirilliplanes yamanashiensis]|uniref:Uncharacterized protein n=1 Tax=Spirilliplanes yamanashiensis TaxID=42233 RepID=A0A8J3Y9N2_9ACTN|nr:DUF6232 family protein [Spirilliplanes yamanashiensis]MDP9815506.1 hypothetical protein [Spirilliplanes yamanashiensis]GIJ03760.1 hypothetical protein Sya03_31120 [Spirilliplanes yamanashiensis]
MPTTYYRSHEVLVTSDAFVWRTDPIRVYRIKHLRDVGIVRGAPAPAGLTATHTAALATGAVATATWPVIHSPVAVAAGLTLAAALTAAAFTTGRDHRRVCELRATYGDRRVVLFASADGQVFRQVTRGLLRAMEAAAEPGSTWYELAGG